MDSAADSTVSDVQDTESGSASGSSPETCISLCAPPLCVPPLPCKRCNEFPNDCLCECSDGSSSDTSSCSTTHTDVMDSSSTLPASTDASDVSPPRVSSKFDKQGSLFIFLFGMFFLSGFPFGA